MLRTGLPRTFVPELRTALTFEAEPQDEAVQVGAEAVGVSVDRVVSYAAMPEPAGSGLS